MIRKYEPIDEDFLYHSWLHSVKCPTKMVTSMTRRVIDDVIEQGNIRVFCPDDDPDHIIGWMAYGKIEHTPLLHFLFVKKDFRMNGLGTELIRSVYPDLEMTIFCTFWSFHMQQLNARKRWNAKFVGNLLPTVVFDIMSRENGRREEKHGP